MIEFFLDLFGFFLKSLIIAFLVVTPLLLIALIMRRKDKSLDQKDGLKIVVKDLRQGMIKRRDNMRKVLKKHHPDKDIEDLNPITKKLKRKHKDADEEDDFQKAKQKREAYLQELKEKEAQGIFCPKNLFVLNFNGGSKGSEVKRLRKEIDALLDVATPKDEVIVNLTSPGGMVNSYGLLSSQLARIRQKNINLVCTVDSVAASGGYLMATVANKIVAAPFAYIGSIGVIASMPNFKRFLDKHEVDYEQVTAGHYKRTLTMFGENTDDARAKFKAELEVIHERFKEQVLKYRPQVDIEKVSTGEYWLAVDAQKLGLVDEIATSDEYIAKRAFDTYDCVLQIMCTRKQKQNFMTKLRDLLMLKHIKHDVYGTILEKMEDNAYRHIK